MSKIERKFISLKFDEASEDGTITGYASIFDEKDSYGDIVLAGAFKNTLKLKDVTDIPLLWQHDPRQPVGAILELREDKKGLWFKAKLLLTISQGRNAYELTKAKIIKGISFGYIAKEFNYNEEYNRIISEVDLWEISLVTFPANTSAGVVDVKSAATTKQNIEELLTRDAGLSRKEAKSLLSGGFNAAFPMRDADEGEETDDDTRDAVVAAQIIAELKQATLKIRG